MCSTHIVGTTQTEMTFKLEKNYKKTQGRDNELEPSEYSNIMGSVNGRR